MQLRKRGTQRRGERSLTGITLFKLQETEGERQHQSHRNWSSWCEKPAKLLSMLFSMNVQESGIPGLSEITGVELKIGDKFNVDVVYLSFLFLPLIQ